VDGVVGGSGIAGCSGVDSAEGSRTIGWWW